jgi:hypothetical protein
MTDDRDRLEPYWRAAMGVTTVVFSVWYFAVLYRWVAPSLLADGFAWLHGVAGVVPAVSEGELRRLVGGVVQWGLGASVVGFLVAFALFHRAVEDGPVSE